MRPTQLFERWQKRAGDACPFGLVFRPGKSSPSREIDSWTYTPGYFPKGFAIEVARDIPVNEPLLIYLPFARPALVEDIEPRPAARIGAIVDVTLHLPRTNGLSPALEALVAAGSVKVEPAREYLLDLKHVGGTKEPIDLRPRCRCASCRSIRLRRRALVNENGRPFGRPFPNYRDTAVARLFLRDPEVDRHRAGRTDGVVDRRRISVHPRNVAAVGLALAPEDNPVVPQISPGPRCRPSGLFHR